MEDRLNKFMHIVDFGGFSKAAKHLRISQPALSISIKKLEKELETQLIIRDLKTLKLTTTGKIAYDTAKSMQVSKLNLQKLVNQINKQPLRVRIGMIDGMADLLFDDTAKNIDIYSGIEFEIHNSRRLLQDVVQNKLDLALITTPSSFNNFISFNKLGIEPLVLITHSKNIKHYSNHEKSKLLTNFINYNPKSNTNKLIENYFKDRGYTLDTKLTSTSPEIILKTISSGNGIGVLPYVRVKNHLKKNILTTITDRPLVIERPIYLIKQNNAVVDSKIEKKLLSLIQVLKQINQELDFQK